MTIKSDRWIIEQAEKGMIEPFEAGQVRGEEGQRVISYGTSSYGYDVRCGNQFKVFTNIHSATVDPKAFDEQSFVDVEDEVCIIPPNSFALASTVEYFRIPEDVLTICLGKVCAAAKVIRTVLCGGHGNSDAISAVLDIAAKGADIM